MFNFFTSEKSLFDLVKEGHGHQAKQKIEQGADPHQKTYWQQWTLLHAVAHTEQTELAEYLLSKGLNINHVSYFNTMTPLHLSASLGNERMTKLFIEENANLNCKTYNEGYTAIHFAIEHNHPNILKLLLDNNADPNVTDSDGRSPLATAIFCSNHKAINMLINYGASISDLASLLRKQEETIHELQEKNTSLRLELSAAHMNRGKEKMGPDYIYYEKHIKTREKN